MRASPSYFSPSLFTFLQDLAAHNNRFWFHKNKHHYESLVKNPMLRFIADFVPHLYAINPHCKADPRPSGGSMFRLYRDTRFSTDKSPYKTSVAARFPHASSDKGVHAPCFYLHLEPKNCLGGGGLWQPEGAVLRAVRDRMVSAPKEWQALLQGGLVVKGEKLQRIPAGYEAQHALAEELKRKEFYAHESFSEQVVCSRAFMTQYVEVCQRTKPLVAFLAKSLALPW